jgi:hypothetical protein
MTSSQSFAFARVCTARVEERCVRRTLRSIASQHGVQRAACVPRAEYAACVCSANALRSVVARARVKHFKTGGFKQQASRDAALASRSSGQHQAVIASRTHTYPNTHTVLEVHERKAFLARGLLTGIACSLVFDTSDAGESNESCSLVRERLSGIHERVGAFQYQQRAARRPRNGGSRQWR